MEHSRSVLHIGKRAFVSVFLILVGLVFAAGILSLFIPAGSYLRDGDSIIADSFQFIPKDQYPFWRWLTAPIEVLFKADRLYVIGISVFLLVLGGTFNVMDKTGGIIILIKRLILRFRHNKYLLLRLVILFFMSFGAFFGIFEESIALLPIMILLALSLGWDSMMGLGMCLLAAGFGFASAITNPFSVGIASGIAGVNLLSGVFFRIGVFIVMYLLLSSFLVRYGKKIEKDPTLSLTYESDLEKTRDFDLNQKLPYPNENRIFTIYLVFFLCLLLTVVGAGILELFIVMPVPAIALMGVIFLFGGGTAGLLVTKDWRFTARTFIKGMFAVSPAIVLILLAVSVKHIITEAQVMDTLLYYLTTALEGRSEWVALMFIYGLVLLIQVFIGSASAKAFLIMPLIIPLVQMVGLTREIAILAFVFGDGFTNVIMPTNGALLIGLSIASVSYVKWFRFTIKLQLITFALTVLLLLGALYIGY